MQAIQCAIVDDKPLAIDLLRRYVEQIPFLTLVYTTTNPLDALSWIDQGLLDLVFLDIQMPELNGVQVMKMVEKRVGIILTTAYPDYALEGFDHGALDYLLKPVSFERFYKAVLKAKAILRHETPGALSGARPPEAARDYLFVKEENRIVRVFYASIQFVEACQNYTLLHSPEGKVMTLQPLRQIEEQLPKPHFVRVHRSYMVNLSCIDSVERNRIFIGKAVIPIGETFQSSFRDILHLR